MQNKLYTNILFNITDTPWRRTIWKPRKYCCLTISTARDEKCEFVADLPGFWKNSPAYFQLFDVAVDTNRYSSTPGCRIHYNSQKSGNSSYPLLALGASVAECKFDTGRKKTDCCHGVLTCQSMKDERRLCVHLTIVINETGVRRS